MKLEVGKTYELSDGKIARCVCADRLREGKLSAVLLYVGTTGSEYSFFCALDGSAHHGGVRVVKEYVPKIKVRVIVFRRGDGTKSTTSIAEGEVAFDDARRGAYISLLLTVTIISDSIVEVEQN
jgi:hypothetical protein